MKEHGLMWKTWWQMQQRLASGCFDPRAVITHRFPLADFDQALTLSGSGQAGKVMLFP